MQVIGQENNLNIIERWQTMPQFLMIQGDKHTGKTHMVIYLCQKFKLYYHLMGNSIDDVRALVKSMVKNSNTVYHFKDFDKASIQAKNALLKIAEEPIEGNYIVITGSSQLKTLESRARILIMSAYDKQDVLNYAMQTYDENVANGLYVAGLNTPAKLYFYKDYEDLVTLMNWAYEIYSRITTLSIDNVLALINGFKARYDGVDACILFLDMLINIIQYNNFNVLGCRYSMYDILNCLIIGKTTLQKRPVLNRKMFMFNTFYNILEINGGRK